MSQMPNSSVAIAIVLIFGFTACAKSPQYSPEEGDIIFHTSRSAQSVAVQRATKSKFSHMGIITLKKGVPYVFEAVNPVKYTPLADWIARGSNGDYKVKRLKNASAILTASAIQKLRESERGFEGKPYNLTFEWSDDRIYCSELVWKIYDRALGISVGKLQQLKDFDLGDSVVKRKLRERYGNSVPLNETVISPSSIFESEKFVTVRN